MIEINELPFVSAEPFFVDRGGLLEGTLGGSDQRINRIGSRWGLNVQLKPMQQQEAQKWISRLTRGLNEGIRIPFPSRTNWAGSNVTSTLNASLPAQSTVAALNLSGAAANKTIPEGTFFSIFDGTRHYVHQIAEDVFLDASGDASNVDIWPMARKSFTTGQSVHVTKPMIEGFVRGNDGRMPWSIDVARMYGLSFSVIEAK